jgi:hypothetical protein
MMKMKIVALILFVSLAVLFASQVTAGENLSPTPGDVALLTGLRTNTDAGAESSIAVRIGPVFLHRQNNDGLTIATDALSGAEILNADDLNLHFAVGYDFTLEGQFGAFGVEARYFGIPDWCADNGLSAPNGSTFWYDTPLYVGATTGTVSYTSDLDSVELSFKWYPRERLAILAGPRYFRLDEDMDMDLTSGAVTGENVVKTTNSLIGVQVGVEGVFFTIGGFSADGWLKAGYYRNEMSSYVALNDSNGWHASSTSDTERGTFVGDLGINLNYAVTPKLLVTAGYQLLWIEKAALAPQQFPAHTLISGVDNTGRTADDDVLYQGIRVGVILLFDIYGKPAPAPEPAPAPVIEPKLEPMGKN